MSQRTWDANASEFKLLSKQGKDVRLALLVACSVGNGRGKTSALDFAKASGASPNRIARHLTAWNELANSTRNVPTADALRPGDATMLTLSDAAVATFNEHYAESFATDPRYAGVADGAAIAAKALEGGTGPAKAVDIAKNTKAMMAAIEASPKVARAAAEALGRRQATNSTPYPRATPVPVHDDQAGDEARMDVAAEVDRLHAAVQLLAGRIRRDPTMAAHLADEIDREADTLHLIASMARGLTAADLDSILDGAR